MTGRRVVRPAAVAAHLAALAPNAEAAAGALDRLHPLEIARSTDARTANGRTAPASTPDAACNPQPIRQGDTVTLRIRAEAGLRPRLFLVLATHGRFGAVELVPADDRRAPHVLALVDELELVASNWRRPRRDPQTRPAASAGACEQGPNIAGTEQI